MTVQFHWNGVFLEAAEGDSIAAALAENGITKLGSSRTGRPRGIFCGMGVCHECLVCVDGIPSVRACMTDVQSGMEICEQNDADVLPRNEEKRNCADTKLERDIVIVGAGPAGLAAGSLLDSWGFSVCILDERKQSGGQYYKPRSRGFRGGSAPDRQHREGDVLRNEAARGSIEFRLGATVWYARRDGNEDAFSVRAIEANGTVSITARIVVIAAGAVETPPVIPGCTVPGVMTIGAAQTLARRYGVLPGRNVLVASNGPLGMQLAAEIQELGANVVALAERGIASNPFALLSAARGFRPTSLRRELVTV